MAQAFTKSNGRETTTGKRCRWLWLCQGALAVFFLLAMLGRAAIAQTPTPSSDTDLQAASSLLLTKHYAQAISLLRKLVPAHENQPEAHIMLAYALFREDQPAASLREYTRAAQLRRPTAEDLKWVALDYVLLGDYNDAQKWMFQSLRMNDSSADSWYDMGRIEYTQNLFKNAERCFQRALALSPRDIDAENNLGLTYEALFRWNDAIAAYRTAIAWQQGSPHPSPEPLLNLGTALLNQNHRAQALAPLQQAAVLAPRNPRVLRQLARANFQLGRLADAESELRTALTISPNEAALHFQLGRVLSKEGKTEQAKAEFAKVAALDGTHSSLSR
ncbi:MAG TPA: tetratricopeptide repeat protein [Acidobacteriaceae bacterium]|nr:tetratricopeptide repeat protein [Acidobacteriaceae bacterium]